MHNEQYRKACASEAGHCQEEIVKIAVTIFNEAFKDCDGDIEKTLTAYNTGRCFPIEKRYVNSVLNYRSSLIKVNEIIIPWCFESDV
jgi:hypothetical protein